MLDVTQILPRGGFDPATVSDRLVLDHDLRLRRRIVLTTEAGRRVRLYEARPVQLRDGDGLRLTNGEIMLVEAAPEPLLEISAHDAAEMVRIAWHLGNRHLPTQLAGDVLRIRYDHVIADMVRGLGGHCRQIRAAFDPEGGAYAQSAARHDHGPGHGHDHP